MSTQVGGNSKSPVENLPVLFRILVRHRLELFRPDQLQLSLGQAFDAGLFDRGGGAYLLRHNDEKRAGVGASGSAEPADGPAQRGRIDRSFRNGRGRGPPEISLFHAVFCNP